MRSPFLDGPTLVAFLENGAGARFSKEQSMSCEGRLSLGKVLSLEYHN